MIEPQRPTLFMMVGLPGAGKSTLAKEIEAEHNALRLTPDDWIVALFGNDARNQRDGARDPVEALQWEVAKRVLALGTNVVLDWGFWSRQERAWYRKEAELLGADAKLVFVAWASMVARYDSNASNIRASSAASDA
jgi:predicted kinase